MLLCCCEPLDLLFLFVAYLFTGPTNAVPSSRQSKPKLAREPFSAKVTKNQNSAVENKKKTLKRLRSDNGPSKAIPKANPYARRANDGQKLNQTTRKLGHQLVSLNLN